MHSLQETKLHEFYEKAGFQGRVGFGERPAILVIDLAKAWVDPSETLGSDLSSVVENTLRILKAARAHGVPVAFTTMAFEDSLADLPAVLRAKTPHLAEMKASSPLVKLDPRLKRDEHREPLIVKPRASAFFATNLLTILNGWRVDTCIITGCSTSGCIRATAESAIDHGFHAIVPREAVGDRSASAHEANLFDIDSRYADVVGTDEVLRYLERLDGAR